jgi:hypothetical protein
MSQNDKTETLSRRLLISGMERHTRKFKGKCGGCASVSLHSLLKCNNVLSGRNVQALEEKYFLHALDSDILNSCQTARRHLSGSQFFVATTKANSNFANLTSCAGNATKFREICLAGRTALLDMNTVIYRSAKKIYTQFNR